MHSFSLALHGTFYSFLLLSKNNLARESMQWKKKLSRTNTRTACQVFLSQETKSRREKKKTELAQLGHLLIFHYCKQSKANKQSPSSSSSSSSVGGDIPSHFLAYTKPSILSWANGTRWQWYGKTMGRPPAVGEKKKKQRPNSFTGSPWALTLVTKCKHN